MNHQIRSTLKIIGTILAIVISAQFTVDVGAIPTTGQTLVVLLLAFFLSPIESFIALSLYLILGFAGAPIFANGSSGLEKLYGGSGGYLIGFLAAAVLVSYMQSFLKLSSLNSILKLTTLGTFVILLFGVVRLSILTDFLTAIDVGLKPFWVGAVVKIILGSLLTWALLKYIKAKQFK